MTKRLVFHPGLPSEETMIAREKKRKKEKGWEKSEKYKAIREELALKKKVKERKGNKRRRI